MRNRVGKIILVIFVIIFTMLILFLISCPVVNDISAKQVLRDIADIPLPNHTQTVAKFSRAGKLVGNGNGMQFFGAVLLESELALEELDQYYSSYRKTEWDYIVKEQRTQSIDVIEHGLASFETEMSDEKNYYIIYSWGEGISPFQDFDLRGN